MKMLYALLIAIGLVACSTNSPVKDNTANAQESIYSGIPTADQLMAFFADFQEALIGGKVVDKNTYNSVVVVTNGQWSCTGTVVGPQAMLMASHCVKEANLAIGKDVNATNELNFTIGGVQYLSTCQPTDQWPEIDHDIALCTIDKPVPNTVKYASISPTSPAKGEIVTLMGYGCTQAGGRGGNDGKLRMGEVKVTKNSNEAQNDFDFWTKGSVALCYGDSGGPVLKRITDGTTQKFIVMGVNSKGDIATTSLLADLGTQASKAFMNRFVQEKGVQICGINLECNNGSDNPGPVPPAPPTGCEKEKAVFLEAIRQTEVAAQAYGQCVSGRTPTP